MVQIYFLYTLVTNATSTQGCGNDERHQDMLIAPRDQVRRMLDCINNEKVSSDIQILKQQFLPDRESDEPIEKRIQDELENVHVGQSNRLVHVDTKVERRIVTSECLIEPLTENIKLFLSTLTRDATCFANPHAVSLVYNTIQYQLSNTIGLFYIYSTIDIFGNWFTNSRDNTSISDDSSSFIPLLGFPSKALINDFKELEVNFEARRESILTAADLYVKSFGNAKENDSIAFDQTKCCKLLLKHINMIDKYWVRVYNLINVLSYCDEKAFSKDFIDALSTYIKNLLMYGCFGAKLLVKETELYISKLCDGAVGSITTNNMLWFRYNFSKMMTNFKKALSRVFEEYGIMIHNYKLIMVYNRNDTEEYKEQQEEIMREYERIAQMLLNFSETPISNAPNSDTIRVIVESLKM